MPIPFVPQQGGTPVPPAPATPTPEIPVPRIIIQTPDGVTGQLAGQSVPIEVLQAQAATLSSQLAGLHEQRDALNQLRGRDNVSDAARAQFDAERAALRVQIAQKEQDLENVRAQIAARKGVPMNQVSEGGQIVQREPRPVVDPELIVGLSFTLLMVFAVPLSFAWARTVWRRAKPAPLPAKLDEVAPRLDRLEQAVDAIAIEVERISEGQRFITKVFSERPAPAPAARAESANADPNQMRALGAGPMEPVRVAERQGVRQVITPH
jgi:hypothetical protein